MTVLLHSKSLICNIFSKVKYKYIKLSYKYVKPAWAKKYTFATKKKIINKVLLYKEEHTGCCRYYTTGIVNNIKSVKGEKLSFCDGAKILFLLKGKLFCNIKGDVKILEENYFVLLPNNRNSIIQVEEDAQICIIDMYKKMSFCNLFSVEMLYNLNKEKKCSNIHHLKIHDRLLDFINCLIKSIDNDLRCEFFLELKQKEMLFYLRAYYSKQDLLYFFSPILNNDVVFANLIYRNYSPTISLQELAEKTNYSLAGFKSKFTKTFGIPPYEWLTKEKAKSIYYDINCTKMTFKEITFQYGFSSQAHFSEFCKNVFGATPSVMRAENINRIII